MGSRAESHIAKAKSLLTEVRHSYSTEPSYWASLTPTVRSAMSYVDSSELLLSPHRHEESAWILREVQDFAYFDADNGGISDLTAWCEQGWGVILHADPYNFAALQGLGEAWLERSQYVLARIYAAEATMTEDQKEDEARLQGSMYTEARKLLASAVDYLQRAVDAAHQQRRLTGTLLARVSISLLFDTKTALC